MTALSQKRGDYPGLAWKAPITEPMMLPDDVLAAQRAAAKPVVGKLFARHVTLDRRGGLVPPLNRHRLLWPAPELDWAQSVALVQGAFDHFDPVFGGKVRNILDDPTRLHRKETTTGDCAAYTTPKGFRDSQQAEITFESDGTISDAVYLAHEVGHMLSFQMAGAEDVMMPRHTIELPAFFTQIMFYDSLSRQADPGLARAGAAHAAGEVTRSLYAQASAYAAQGLDDAAASPAYKERMAAALGEEWAYFRGAERADFRAYDLHTYASAPLIGLGLYYVAPRSPQLLEAIFARGGNADILDILAAAGVTTLPQLEEFFTAALRHAESPLLACEAAAIAA